MQMSNVFLKEAVAGSLEKRQEGASSWGFISEVCRLKSFTNSYLLKWKTCGLLSPPQPPAPSEHLCPLLVPPAAETVSWNSRQGESPEDGPWGMHQSGPLLSKRGATPDRSGRLKPRAAGSAALEPCDQRQTSGLPPPGRRW